MKRLLLAVILVAAVVVICSCTPKRDSVPIFWGNTPNQAKLASELRAKEIGGLSLQMLNTGSMEPFITGGDYLVVDTRVDYKDIKQGWLLNYKARWLPANAPLVAHWAAAKHGDEWIMDGQHNSHYENQPNQLMGKKEFEAINGFLMREGGRVVAIYTTRTKP